ncbi:hypothetical protein PHSY_000537 [Pseudozyma hubeiensis SY62]|uniref:Uncharacterized protein n=1 Tax=Pseudozyma hubeiensis (strain SY62) TaxID=1305764 RepID=R9NWV5_PSEHS|nr:hypothetical protein PHSY_000537 [Pseudozyma hubeiensis SY62]GAC92977.1 hypothetical protein PHSY_000537 [Pseudozyma hubeiensis SY62]
MRSEPLQAEASDSSSSSVSIPFEEIARSSRALQSSYRRFFFFHVLSLLPTLVILIVALWGTIQTRELCHIQDEFTSITKSRLHPAHSVYQRGRCRSILDGQLLASTLALGLVGWLASYTSRKACLAFADRLIPRLLSSSLSLFSRSPRFQLPRSEQGSGKDSLIVTVAIAMQALIAESLRVLSFYWACCILVTALYLYPIQERNSHRPHALDSIAQSLATANTGPDWAWRLSFRDPRFFVAAWSSIAWALAEFGFGAFQILHQVALYKPVDVEEELKTDVADGDRPVAGQSGFSLLSGHPGANSDRVSTPERSTGKARRMSASRALEQARQRLVQPSTESTAASRQQNYGAMGSLNEAVEEASHSDAVTDDDDESESSRASDSDFSATTISLLDQELEEEVERFLVAKERSEVEAVLGVPLPEIPVALCALWRIDAMLWSIGSSLLLSASFTHAQGALGHLSHDRFDLSSHFNLLPPFGGFGITFGVLVILHTIVSSLWATSLPLVGFATTTYASLLFGLAIMVASLARWGLLI